MTEPSTTDRAYRVLRRMGRLINTHTKDAA